MEKKCQLQLEDCICPICMYILVEPVTMPCQHELCMTCFQQNVAEANLSCPMCRSRISTWARKATRCRTLINQERWRQIQTCFPDKVQKRLEGRDDDEGDIMTWSPVNIHIAAPGEIRREYEEQVQRLATQAALERQREQEASEALIRQLQIEEQSLVNRRQEEEKDEALAKQLSQVMNEAGTDSPISLLLAESERRVTRKKSVSSDIESKGNNTIHDFIRKLQKAESSKCEESSTSFNDSRVSSVNGQSPGITILDNDSSDCLFSTDTTPFTRASDSSYLGRPVDIADNYTSTSLKPHGFDTDAIFCGGNLSKVVFVSDTDSNDTSSSNKPFSSCTASTTMRLSSTSVSTTTSSSARSRPTTSPFPMPVKSTCISNSNISPDDELPDVSSDSLMEDVGIRQKRPRCASTESNDSISPELVHFKPIRACPKTPPKRLSNGKLYAPPIIKSTPLRLNTFGSNTKLSRDTTSQSPALKKRIIDMCSHVHNRSIESLSKSTSTNDFGNAPQHLTGRHQRPNAPTSIPNSPLSPPRRTSFLHDLDTDIHPSPFIAPVIPLEPDLESYDEVDSLHVLMSLSRKHQKFATLPGQKTFNSVIPTHTATASNSDSSLMQNKLPAQVLGSSKMFQNSNVHRSRHKSSGGTIRSKSTPLSPQPTIKEMFSCLRKCSTSVPDPSLSSTHEVIILDDGSSKENTPIPLEKVNLQASESLTASEISNFKKIAELKSKCLSKLSSVNKTVTPKSRTLDGFLTKLDSGKKGKVSEIPHSSSSSAVDKEKPVKKQRRGKRLVTRPVRRRNAASFCSDSELSTDVDENFSPQKTKKLRRKTSENTTTSRRRKTKDPTYTVVNSNSNKCLASRTTRTARISEQVCETTASDSSDFELSPRRLVKDRFKGSLRDYITGVRKRRRASGDKKSDSSPEKSTPDSKSKNLTNDRPITDRTTINNAKQCLTFDCSHDDPSSITEISTPCSQEKRDRQFALWLQKQFEEEAINRRAVVRKKGSPDEYPIRRKKVGISS